MNLATLFRRGVPVPVWCGLVASLFLASGCGPKPAAPAPVAKPKADAAKAAASTAASTNAPDEYVSVFEEMPSPKGKDPFFPYSHRRDVKTESVQSASVHVDPVLVLKAIIRTSKRSQAVINNEILEAGEEQPIRVPNGKVRVRCLEIGKNYVLVQVEGETEPKRLMMEQKKY